jgi:hypothetical protein
VPTDKIGFREIERQPIVEGRLPDPDRRTSSSWPEGMRDAGYTAGVA